MNLYEMKGLGTVVATLFLKENQRLEVVRYSDQSLGIVRDGKIVGIWEVAEFEDCWTTFMRLGGLDQPDAGVVIVCPQGSLNSNASAVLEPVCSN